jgi:hypothetical protein
MTSDGAISAHNPISDVRRERIRHAVPRRLDFLLMNEVPVGSQLVRELEGDGEPLEVEDIPSKFERREGLKNDGIHLGVSDAPSDAGDLGTEPSELVQMSGHVASLR